MHRLFRLRVKKAWVCGDCDAVHVNSEKEIGLSLGMPDNENKRRGLHWYLENHFATETISGLECHSAACKVMEDVYMRGDREITSKIVGGPEILVIQLKRMRQNEFGGFDKVMDRVKYPERLDLSNHSDGSLSYQLNGVVAHNGVTLEGGHYVAIVRSQRGDGFVICNDKEIDDTKTKRQVLAQVNGTEFQSYLLIYQKTGGRMVNRI